MSVIKKMDEKLANMIAAGEVVERPASIVKELIENSIDAKANVIDVYIKDIGLSLIKVTDNGVGMSKSDMKKAFMRHATSKVFHEKDLTRINTLGFRGEALAAILSVSKVNIKSRQKLKDGYYVKYVNSKIEDEGVATLNEGTEIEVRDLFYNTPARLKYLKSEFSERQAIIDIFDRLALSNPNIRMSLTINDKLIKETFGNDDYYSLISQIYGSNVLKDIKHFKESFANVLVEGYLISPKFSRSNKKDITLFVNGRYVRNYQLTNAVINGYSEFLMTNRYPLALISIKMDPYLLDVNIHPQKLEVKMSNESLLTYQLESIIKKILNETSHEIVENIDILDKDLKDNEDEKYIKESLDFEYNLKNDIRNKDIIKSTEKIPSMEYVGNFASTYLLFQNEKGLYLIDQHAAEERVNYEYYMEKLNTYENIKIDLLIPYELNITKSDKEFINENIEKFNKALFYFDKNMNLISHPNYILENDLNDAIIKSINILNNKKEISISSLLNDLAKDISCKASVKANYKLSLKEVESLYERLKNAKNPYTCPHGRPTIIHLTHYQVERMFKRIV